MVLVQKVLDILNSIEDIQTVIYDSGFSANVRIDRKPMPMALFYLLNDWSIDLSKSTAIKEAANIQIFFADTANFDAKGEDKDLIVMRMELIAREFIRRILEDRSIVVVNRKGSSKLLIKLDVGVCNSIHHNTSKIVEVFPFAEHINAADKVYTVLFRSDGLNFFQINIVFSFIERRNADGVHTMSWKCILEQCGAWTYSGISKWYYMV